MPQVLVRGLDTDTLERLKRRASLAGRSLQQELRVILEDAARRSWHDTREEAARIRAGFGERAFDDSTALVREDRDR